MFESSYRILLSFGVDVDLKDNKNYTPLFYASSSGSLANLLELLDRGHADVNHVSSLNKTTALIKAYSHEVIRLLLKYGAEASWFDLKTFLQYHTEISTRAILSKSIFTKKVFWICWRSVMKFVTIKSNYFKCFETSHFSFIILSILLFVFLNFLHFNANKFWHGVPLHFCILKNLKLVRF